MYRRFLAAIAAFALCVPALAMAEGETLAPPPDQGLTQTLVMITIAMVFFYFILWRPEQKRRKEIENQRSGLKKGDRVTAMGIIGTVISVKEHTVILKMYDGAKIEMLKAAISEILSEETPPEESHSSASGKRVDLKVSPQ